LFGCKPRSTRYTHKVSVGIETGPVRFRNNLVLYIAEVGFSLGNDPHERYTPSNQEGT
jgi:hypothetical protein